MVVQMVPARIRLVARLDKTIQEQLDSLQKLVGNHQQLCLVLVGMKEAFPVRPGSPYVVAAEAPRTHSAGSGTWG